MMNFIRKSPSLIVTSLLALETGLGCSQERASDVAAPRSTALTIEVPSEVNASDLAIPADYVRTPNGFFHKTCIIQVEEDEVVVPGDHIRKNSGAVREIRPCRYGPLDAHGQAIDHRKAKHGTAPYADGWLADGELANVTVSKISANWTVPSAPSNTSGGQILYFFPGLEPLAGNEILQPVLGFNAVDKPGQWSIQSWLCCDATWNQYTSAALAVQAVGDTISGYAQGSGCNSSTGVCSNWQVSTSDIHGGSTISTTLNIGYPSNPPSYSTVIDYSFGGAMEAHYLSHCNQLPANDFMSFTSVALYDINGTQISSPTWDSVTYYYGTGPQCLYSVSSTSSEVDISWDHKGCDYDKIDCGPGNPPQTRCISSSQHCP